MAAASAIASRPDGQADDTVAAFAQIPIRSAIALAAACGIIWVVVVGGTRFGPFSRTASNARSSTSMALELTPITTGVGLGNSRLSGSSPASLNAIIVAAYA